MSEGSDAEDLEDGELLSSGEEEASDTKEKELTLSRNHEVQHPSLPQALNDHDNSIKTQPTIDPVSDDGEIYSDDEQSAYYPQQVKSRSTTNRPKQETVKRPSRWSDSYQQSSPSKSGGYGDKPRKGSPERRRKRDRSESSDKEMEIFFEDRDGSDRESKERRSSRERRHDSPNRSGDYRVRSGDLQSSPGPRDQDGKRDYHSSPSYSRYGNQEYGNQRNSSWSRHGGYGSSSPHQQGNPRYGRSRGGYGPKRFHQTNTGMSAKEFHMLASQVVRRKEQGLSLLPAPRAPRQSRVDLSMYPSPPTWYLRELQFWDTKRKEQKDKVQATASSVPPATPGPVPPGVSTVPPVASTSSSLSSPSPVPPGIPAVPLMAPNTSLSAPGPVPDTPIPLIPPNLTQAIGEQSSVVESAHTFPTTPSGDVESYISGVSSSQAQDNIPLDPNMPFAQPLPSSYRPPPLFPAHSDNQPLNPTQGDTPGSLSLVPHSMESTNDIAQSTTPDTPGNLIIPPQFGEVVTPDSSVKPDALNNDTTADVAQEAADEVSSVTSSDLKGAEMTGVEVTSSFLERSMSVSSEVRMEIDLHDQESSQPSNNLLPPALPSTDQLQANSQTSTSVTSPPIDTPLSGAIENQLSLPTTQFSNISTPFESNPAVSSSSMPSLSLCNSETDSEPIKYNLRPRASSRDSDKRRTETPPPVVVMDVSDEEDVDYDTYLDQLDDEEIPVIPTLTSSLSQLLQEGVPKIDDLGVTSDPFLEDFPLISKEASPKEAPNQNETLMNLVGQGTTKPQPSTDSPSVSGVKSTRRKEKELTWRAKQRQRAAASKESVVERAPRPLCKYFMNGMCKNGDSCSFSHEGTPAKKKEVCKFYKLDTCNKGQDCMYYHGEFPCKFFHTNSFCKYGDHCKFSHSPLTTETETLLASVIEAKTPPSSTPSHTFTLPPPPDHSSTEERVRICESPYEGFQIKMFGSQDKQTELMVSLPKSEELIVSIPLTKLTDKMKFGRIPKKIPPSSTASTNLPCQNNVAPQLASTQVPTPLFPGGSLDDQTKGQHPRKFLLPTPPASVRLTPEDFKRMETMPHEYWEAPEIANPTSHPSGGPQWRPPYDARFRPRHPFPPRHKQPFFRPPGPRGMPTPPEQNWNQHPNYRPPWPGSAGMEHGAPGMRIGPTGTNPRQAGMELGSSGLGPGGIESKPGGIDPRHSSNDPRHSSHDPRFSNQNDPRQSSSQAPNHGVGSKWGPPVKPEHKHFQSSYPISSSPPLPRFPQGSSPPPSFNDQSSPVWSVSDKMSPSWKPDRDSPSWGTSPDHSSTLKGAADTTTKRVDPRKKYSHLKIKTKGQSSSPQQPLVKETDSSVPGYKIPKLLKDPASLEKPIDPTELFGVGSTESQPYGEITFGTYKSPFSQRLEAKDSQPSFGEINLQGDAQVTQKTDETSKSTKDDDRTLSETKQEAANVPSYFAQIDLGLDGGDLKIESAFGSLSDKSKTEEDEVKGQESHARKFPSVFGYGL